MIEELQCIKKWAYTCILKGFFEKKIMNLIIFLKILILNLNV